MSKASAKVRMYRLNELGDCFLVTLAADGATSRLLIDCGSFRNIKASIDRIKDIAAAIHKDLKGEPLDVIAGTHQHNDHLSGFVHAEKEFRNIKARQVWLSWLDDPADAAARKIGKEHKNLVSSLHKARRALGNKPLGAKGNRARQVLEDVLGFYGAAPKGAAGGPPEVPANAVKILKDIGIQKPKFLEPGDVFDMPGLPKDSVRVYVLGPPRDDKLLFDATPKKDETFDPHLAVLGLGALAARNLSAEKFLSAVSTLGAAGKRRQASPDEVQYPFAGPYKMQGGDLRSGPLKKMLAHYRRDKSRNIDDDWMDQAESLALYLDSFTNNSSLVLAIELVASGKVLLFAADAQTGNWLSWSGVKFKSGVTVDDLLARTVFYKVGHHASHNATLPKAFEKMTSPDLVALIPVHKQDPNITKKGGWKMPAKNLFKKLVDQTRNRVLQMDNDNPANCDPKKDPARSSWKKVGIKPNISELFIELEFAE
jgi:glyoxylase-like metal-dependent hydrolase (beta-lactamase superfamily II)